MNKRIVLVYTNNFSEFIVLQDYSKDKARNYYIKNVKYINSLIIPSIYE